VEGSTCPGEALATTEGPTRWSDEGSVGRTVAQVITSKRKSSDLFAGEWLRAPATAEIERRTRMHKWGYILTRLGRSFPSSLDRRQMFSEVFSYLPLSADSVVVEDDAIPPDVEW
jgi:hypothetical protein